MMMADVEMNKGVQILLERMSSNPDEFVPSLRGGYLAKWRDILISVEMRVNGGKEYKDQLPFLNDKEVKALWEKMQSLRGDLFTKQVMDTLLRDAHEPDYMVSLPTTVMPPLTAEELSSLSRQVSSGRLKIPPQIQNTGAVSGTITITPPVKKLRP
jgi:hypothetical protein